MIHVSRFKLLQVNYHESKSIHALECHISKPAFQMNILSTGLISNAKKIHLNTLKSTSSSPFLFFKQDHVASSI